MKKNILILFISFFLFLSSFPCYGLDKEIDDGYVIDNALILKDDTRDYIELYSNYIKEALKIDYYLVTLPSLEGTSIEEYTEDIFKLLDLKEKGILIVVSKKDRKIRVRVGENLADIITDQIIDKYLDSYFVPYFINDEWDKGIKNGYSAFYKLLCEYYNIDSLAMQVTDGNNFIIKYKYYILIFIVWIVTFLAYFISESLKKILNKKKIKMQDKVTLIFYVVLNIIFLFIVYLLLPLALIVLFLFEVETIISDVWPLYKKKQKKRKKHSKRKKPNK